MNLLEAHPDAEEILVERVHLHRWAEREDRYEETYKMIQTGKY